MSNQPVSTIELRLDRIAQLFDPFDPFPTPSRALAKSAEEFIVGWARELPAGSRIKILVHVPEDEARSEEAGGLRDAISRHFSYRAERVRGDVHELFRTGRWSLAVGLGVLGVCVLVGHVVAGALGDNPVARFLTEGLFILGWVANWRPIEIFLYDWWPFTQRRKLFEQLATAPVEVRSFSAD